MANTNSRAGNGAHRGALPGPIPGLVDAAPRSRVIIEYDVPDDEGLHGEVTPSFGSIRTICIKLLTPLEEKDAARAAGEGIQLAYELTRRSIAEIINENSERIAVHNHDGTSNELWAQMHPKLRQLAMQAYADNSTPDASTGKSFLASRRIKA